MINLNYSYFEYLVELFASVLETSIFLSYFGATLKRKFNNLYIYPLAGLVIVSTITTFDRLNLFINYKGMVVLFLYFLIVQLLYEGKFVNKILVNLTSFALLLIADLATYSIENMLTNSNMVLPPIYNRLSMILISKIIFLVIVRISSRRKIISNTKISSLYYYFIITMPLITIAIFFILYDFLHLNPEDIFSIVLIISFGVLFVNLFVYYAFETHIKGIQTQNDAKLMQQQCQLQLKHFENIEKYQDNLRSIKHDINNHFFCIKSFIEKGYIDDAINYIASIDDRLTHTDIFSNCGNVVIDALLNNKYETLVIENINISKIILVPKTLNIENDDLCIVLSNILDNAIEACKKIKSVERYIDLSIEYKKNLFFITIKNNFEEDPILSDGKLITSKDDSWFHGIGLKNVKSTIEKYNGYININIENNVFCANIFMCDVKI